MKQKLSKTIKRIEFLGFFLLPTILMVFAYGNVLYDYQKIDGSIGYSYIGIGTTLFIGVMSLLIQFVILDILKKYQRVDTLKSFLPILVICF